MVCPDHNGSPCPEDLFCDTIVWAAAPMSTRGINSARTKNFIGVALLNFFASSLSPLLPDSAP
jgi:hypothetical protein